MLERVVAIIGVACVSACSVDYLDAETDQTVGGSGGVGGTAGASGNCSTVAEDYTGDPSAIEDWVIGKYEGNYWVALRFHVNANEVACGAGVMMHATGASVPGTMEVSIHEDVATLPGPVIGVTSASVSGAAISVDPALVTFFGLSASLEAGQNYFLVLHKQGNDETNHVVIHHSNGVIADGQSLSGEDGTNWSLNGWEQGLLQIFR